MRTRQRSEPKHRQAVRFAAYQVAERDEYWRQCAAMDEPTFMRFHDKPPACWASVFYRLRFKAQTRIGGRRADQGRACDARDIRQGQRAGRAFRHLGDQHECFAQLRSWSA